MIARQLVHKGNVGRIGCFCARGRVGDQPIIGNNDDKPQVIMCWIVVEYEVVPIEGYPIEDRHIGKECICASMPVRMLQS